VLVVAVRLILRRRYRTAWNDAVSPAQCYKC
jgi:hypothetical protein